MNSKRFLYFQAEWYLVVFVPAETWDPEIHPFPASLLMIALTYTLFVRPVCHPPLPTVFFFAEFKRCEGIHISRSTINRVCVKHLKFSMVSNTLDHRGMQQTLCMHIHALCLRLTFCFSWPCRSFYATRVFSSSAPRNLIHDRMTLPG